MIKIHLFYRSVPQGSQYTRSYYLAIKYLLLYNFAFSIAANDPLSHLKNKDADSTNPNLYHCIDDDKLDHVYDEIKHKEGFGEYHLYYFLFHCSSHIGNDTIFPDLDRRICKDSES